MFTSRGKIHLRTLPFHYISPCFARHDQDKMQAVNEPHSLKMNITVVFVGSSQSGWSWRNHVD